MNNPQRIKPLLTHQISIKSLYTYRTFLKRRPKKAQTVKFSEQGSESRSNLTQMKQIQAKLFKVLEHARPIRKVDLSQYLLSQDYFGECKLHSILKRISKLKVLSLIRFLYGKNYIEKSFRYFKEMQRFQYQIEGSFGVFNNPFNLFPQHQPSEYSLSTLRYCQKLQKILLGKRTGNYCFQRTSKKFLCTRRKYLAMKNLLLDRVLPDSIMKSLNELTSVYFEYLNRIPFFGQIDRLTFIQDLPDLQKIHLKLENDPGYDLKKVFQKIIKKDTLKKLKLDLNLVCSLKLSQILEALNHSRISHFSLKAFVIENSLLASLAEFLKDLNQLESLKLDLGQYSQEAFNPYNQLCQLCEQITKLSLLCHLKFAFNAPRKIPKNQRLPNFVQKLFPVFKKPVKLEALHISCNLVDHSEVFSDLMIAMQGLQTSLLKLKLDIGVPARNQKSHKAVVNFIKNLSNLRVLKLPCIDVNSNQSLNEITESALKLKYLETILIGDIHKNVEARVYLANIRTLLYKKGLRKLHCQTNTEDLWRTTNIGMISLIEHKYEIENILKANPCLEDVFLSHYNSHPSITSEIHRWHEKQRDFFGNFFFEFVRTQNFVVIP